MGHKSKNKSIIKNKHHYYWQFQRNSINTEKNGVKGWMIELIDQHENFFIGDKAGPETLQVPGLQPCCFFGQAAVCDYENFWSVNCIFLSKLKCEFFGGCFRLASAMKDQVWTNVSVCRAELKYSDCRLNNVPEANWEDNSSISRPLRRERKIGINEFGIECMF